MTGRRRAMSDERVLVDTSVWISFFRRPDEVVSNKLKHLLRNGNPAYTGLIATELIRGAKSKKEQVALDDLFRSIEYFETREEYFERAGELGRMLSHKGITIATVDLIIAQIALDNNAALFTLDAHFKLLARYASLRLY